MTRWNDDALEAYLERVKEAIEDDNLSHVETVKRILTLTGTLIQIQDQIITHGSVDE